MLHYAHLSGGHGGPGMGEAYALSAVMDRLEWRALHLWPARWRLAHTQRQHINRGLGEAVTWTITPYYQLDVKSLMLVRLESRNPDALIKCTRFDLDKLIFLDEGPKIPREDLVDIGAHFRKWLKQ